MSKQLYKNFTDGQVKLLFEKYSKGEIKLNYILQILRIKRSRFFELLAKYRKVLDSFSTQYNRKTINRKIDSDIEKNIVKEIKIEKDLIKAKDILNIRGNGATTRIFPNFICCLYLQSFRI